MAVRGSSGWTGIVAEPARIWHQALTKNRTCAVDLRCVSAASGSQVKFLEVADPALSSTADYANCGDMHSQYRLTKSISYDVETVSLDDLLEQHNAPLEIGYMSIDTEGGEYDILNSFDFSRHKIHVISVEHNYREPERSELFKLLTAHGYERKHEDLSRFDDWYVLAGRGV